MRKLRLMTAGAIIAAVLSGCGSSVDEERLAQLTGTLNFEQVKKAYMISMAQEKPEDVKIYAYWLEKNGKIAQATFNFEYFKKDVRSEYQKQVDKIKKQMSEIKKDVDKNIKNETVTYSIIKKLKQEKNQSAWFAASSAYIRNTYIPFLAKQIKKLKDAREAAQKSN